MWIIYTLLQSFLYGLTNIVDTYTVRKYGETKWGVWGPMMFLGIFTIVVSSVLLVIFGIQAGLGDIVKLLSAGLFFMLGMIPYTVSVRDHEVSRVMTLLLILIPVCSYFLGLFLGEQISVTKIGISVVILGLGYLFAIVGGYRGIHEDKSPIHLVLFALMSAFCWSFSAFLFKWGEMGNGYFSSLGIEYLGMSLTFFAYLLIPVFRASFFGLLRSSKKLLGLMSINEALGGIATFFVTLAIVNAPLFYVSLLGNVSQPIFVFLLVILTTRFFPQILQEPMKKGVVYKKIAIMLCMMGMLYFLLS